jgi:hypothetical protein
LTCVARRRPTGIQFTRARFAVHPLARSARIDIALFMRLLGSRISCG